MSGIFESVNTALLFAIAKVSGCCSERCCCYGAEAFECKTGIYIEALSKAIAAAVGDDLKDFDTSEYTFSEAEAIRRFIEENLK